MRSLLLPLVVVLGLIAGCERDSEPTDPTPAASPSPTPPSVDGLPAWVQGPGVFDVGVQVAPGTYVAEVDTFDSCLAFVTKTREFDLEQDSLDADAPYTMFLGDQVRIELTEATFFHVVACDERWTRLSDEEAAATDPGTVEGACLVLTEELLDDVLSFPEERDTRRDDDLRQRLQMTLFGLTYADLEDDAGLGTPAGLLNDYLDDPAGYYEDGELVAYIAEPLETIRTACGH